MRPAQKSCRVPNITLLSIKNGQYALSENQMTSGPQIGNLSRIKI